MEKLLDAGTIARGDRVGVISTAHGLKFVDVKVKYHEMSLPGVESAHANPPIPMPPRYADVRDEMLRQIERRFHR
jgi:threonine synthase